MLLKFGMVANIFRFIRGFKGWGYFSLKGFLDVAIVVFMIQT
tara:strand:+ start:80952 stop:81077 length:126 start_codon:yes stop_codon:yes gene_type:complete